METKTIEQLEREIEYKKEDIRNSKVGFSFAEQEKFREELIDLEKQLKEGRQGIPPHHK
jgi:hypothetical protein